jgi:hypothetical protein
VQVLEDDMEELGTAMSKILSLAGQYWPMWDSSQTGQARPATSPQVPSLRPVAGDNTPPQGRMPFLQIWHEILSWLRLICSPPTDDDTLYDWWAAAR